MPVPAAGDIWRTRADVGGDAEKITASWGQIEDLRIGECVYRAIPGEIVYSCPDYSEVEGMVFLPDLGFAFLTTSSADGDDFVAEYVMQSIAVVGQDQ
ncbi:MAG: hypothetical protein IIX61_10150, partial [Loktanella sp.]|nr:hypothetical protein [Loktanella sp.]